MSREVTEPVVVIPVFCDGLHAIEIDRHGIARLTLYAEQREAYGGTMERVVAARLILPGGVIRDIAARMLAAPQAPAPDPYAEQRRSMN